MNNEPTPAKVRLTEGLGHTPPLPRKKPAVFHHPMGFELYDALAMDLHAMTYAEPLLAEIARLRDVLERIGAMDPKTDSIEGFNEWGEADCFHQAQSAALMALGPNVGAKRAATAQPLSVRLSDQFGHTEKD